jgi:hypothetical protein
MFPFAMGYTSGQRSAARAASLARDAAVSDGTRHTNRLEELEDRIDRLALVVRAMWALLEDGGVTPEQLAAKIEQLDLEDGVADGRGRRMATDCPSCGSKVPAELARCQYCGAGMSGRSDHPLNQL